MECFNTIFRENSRIRRTDHIDQERRLPIWTVSQRILVSLTICRIILKLTVYLPSIFSCFLTRNSRNGLWRKIKGEWILKLFVVQSTSFRNCHFPIREAGSNCDNHILLGKRFGPMQPIFLPISFVRDWRVRKVSSRSPFLNCIKDHLYQ